MNPKLSPALRVAVATTVAEILLVIWWTFSNAPPDASLLAGGIWALAKVAPLLLVLPGLLRAHHRASAWLCFLMCAYFIGAVLTASAPPPARWVGGVEIVIVSVVFVAAMLATRWTRTPKTAE